MIFAMTLTGKKPKY